MLRRYRFTKQKCKSDSGRNQKKKAQHKSPGAQSIIIRIVADFGSYAEQISPRKVDDRSMTIVSGGIEITSTTFCLRLGTSPRQQAPLLPLIPSNRRPQYFHSPGLAIVFASLSQGWKGRRNRERLSCTLAPASPIWKVRIRTATSSVHHDRNSPHGRC